MPFFIGYFCAFDQVVTVVGIWIKNKFEVLKLGIMRRIGER